MSAFSDWVNSIQTVWACDEPPYSQPYQVIRDEWDMDSDPPVRTIHEVKLLSELEAYIRLLLQERLRLQEEADLVRWVGVPDSTVPGCSPELLGITP